MNKFITKLLLLFITIRMFIQNLYSSILDKIYVTRSVTIYKSGNTTSVYIRYILIYWCMCINHFLSTFILDYLYSCLDVNSSTIQFVINIDNVERYIIYTNRVQTNVIMNAIKYIQEKMDTNIVLPKQVVMKCNIVSKDNTIIDLKYIFDKYKNMKEHTIGDILLYNNIDYGNDDKIVITKYNKNSVKKSIMSYDIQDIKNLCIHELYDFS